VELSPVSIIIPRGASSVERTPEAVAVDITKTEGGSCHSDPPTVSPGTDQTLFLYPEQTSSPSLVHVLHNSTDGTRELVSACPAAGMMKGRCKHGTVRWVFLPCKRRGCPVCGERRKKRIAARIRYGIEQLGGDYGAAWFVGTFDRDIEKKEAVRVVGKMVRWIRKQAGVQIEYACTWELTERGRLHVNLILAPWAYVPQSVLSEAWQRFGGGKRVWIQRVGANIGNETAKAGRTKISNYVAKWDQMVQTGRGVTYSKGWPKMPESETMHRHGDIDWYWVGCLEPEYSQFEGEYKLRYWREVSPGEFAFAFGEDCDCFDSS